jgi:glycosyltransferase involved in cell wall biosynthesis
MKKLILVFVYELRNFPPVISIIKMLSKLDYELVIIAKLLNIDNDKIVEGYSEIKYIDISTFNRHNNILLKSTIGKHAMRRNIWKTINRNYDNDTSLWIVSDATVLLLGKRLLKYRYYLELLELSQKWLRFSRISWLTINPKVFLHRAIKVIDVEYNRAQILRAWFDLNETPIIIPNKPYLENVPSLYSNNIISTEHKKLLENLKDRKIILYQGIVNNERPLEAYIQAVSELGEEYAFVIMSNKTNLYHHIKSNNLYFLPFLNPPSHLDVTSHAYIGILSYVPNHKNGYSPLNSIYCAPNKIFEYSMFGIPMIGNDIPGLSIPFKTNSIGISLEKLTPDSVIKAIKKIENDYDFMSSSALKYYQSYELLEIVKKILNN